jgi:hypothetical protein
MTTLAQTIIFSISILSTRKGIVSGGTLHKIDSDT